MRAPFSPPPYPYERLDALRSVAESIPGGIVDCSIGTPCDPPPQLVVDALATSGLERGYPTSAGSIGLRTAAADWLARRFEVRVQPGSLAVCVGTKELVASSAHFLSLRQPDRSVVLYPDVSYPTYAMGATLAGLEPVPVPTEDGRLLLEEIDDETARRALLLWSNSPSNPTGGLDDLGRVAAWGRERGVLVLSDECYAEFTWADRPRSILEHGSEGVLAVHSLSKRSNLAGIRVGFYAGDEAVVSYLASVRQHSGLMVPGPIQAAAALAFEDDEHVMVQRARYEERLALVAAGLVAAGIPAEVPAGGFYLWVRVPDDLVDGWALAEMLAERAGMLVSPGDLYGPAGASHVRIAVVQPSDRLALAMERLSASS